jgi:aryl-alcohol dehydrogenase
MSAVLGAVVCGCTTIIAVDIHANRLEMAKEFGATHTINAGEVNPVEAIQDITGGGAAFSLECVGDPKVFRQAVDALPVGGVCGLVGAAPKGKEVGLDMQTILNARTVRGIIEGDAVSDLFIPKLIDLYKQGRLPYERMIKFYPLDDINQAVEDMEKGHVIKPVLKP